MACGQRESESQHYPIRTPAAGKVMLKDDFWQPRIKTNKEVTIPFGFEMCRHTGRLDNFRIAGGLEKGAFRSSFPFDDSDVYKIIEGASRVIAQDPDPSLERYLDSLIFYISAAQEDDGYLQTWRTIDPENPGDDWWGGPDRWSSLRDGHELYNAGHLYEAAAAHYQATGKTSLLDVALKNADLLTTVFGDGKRKDVPGHEEIEIGLVKLYQITGKQKYLELARFFVNERGQQADRETWGKYYQDHMPVREQRMAVGHAVRAGYLYSAMTDLTAFTGDRSYMPALESIWNDVVNTKTYITGGVGASRNGEAFGAPYELPNDEAYAETCAAIANVLWNHRMFLLTGDGKYVDVLEKALYNGLISGVSLSGDRFFYPNPLYSDGHTAFNYGSATRQQWFPCACCPSNISRFLPSVPEFFYGVKEDTLFVSLYGAGRADINLGKVDLVIEQVTSYPWSGSVAININSRENRRIMLALRIPGWALNRPLPGNLYKTLNPVRQVPLIHLEGNPVPLAVVRGFVFVELQGKEAYKILLDLPMEIMKIGPNPEIAEDKGLVALQRGPIVYCFEEADSGKSIDDVKISRECRLETSESGTFTGVTEIRVRETGNTFTAIPYSLWSNRGVNKMRVWVPGD